MCGLHALEDAYEPLAEMRVGEHERVLPGVGSLGESIGKPSQRIDPPAATTGAVSSDAIEPALDSALPPERRPASEDLEEDILRHVVCGLVGADQMPGPSGNLGRERAEQSRLCLAVPGLGSVEQRAPGDERRFVSRPRDDVGPARASAGRLRRDVRDTCGGWRHATPR